ncbi:MAG: DnaJ domain-containing protein [Candidatus Rifleibacteriota bacterium]
MKEAARIFFLLILAVFYLFLPYDLLPDFMGRFGRIDDLLVGLIIVFLVFFKPLFDDLRNRARCSRNESFKTEINDEITDDPFEILGILPSAGPEEVKKAYHEKIRQYHPDLVAKMGPEIQALAIEKSRQINLAYEKLKKNF